MRDELNQSNQLPCVGEGRVFCEEEYAAQLIGTHIRDYDGQEYLEEVIIAQLDTLHWSHS